MDEIFSAAQARHVANEANQAMAKCMHYLEKSTKELSYRTSKIWSDSNAKYCFREYKRAMTSIVDSLERNNRAFISRVEDIANYYAKVGNMGLVSLNAVKLTPNFDVSDVGEFFADEISFFGFKNTTNGPADVMAVYDDVDKALATSVEEIVQTLKNIPAFGNPNVREAIAQSAGKVVSILQEGFDYCKEGMREAVETAAEDYKRAGLYGEQTARESYQGMTAESSRIESASSPTNTSDTPTTPKKPSNVTGLMDASESIL